MSVIALSYSPDFLTHKNRRDARDLHHIASDPPTGKAQEHHHSKVQVAYEHEVLS